MALLSTASQLLKERQKAIHVIVDCSSSYFLALEAMSTASLAMSFLSHPPRKLMTVSLVPSCSLNIFR